MLAPDDHRHGTNTGYNAGCDESCCKDAHAAYRRNLRTRHYIEHVESFYVDSRPSARRIRALQAIGWPLIELDRQMGRVTDRPGGTWSHNVIRARRMHLDGARAVAALYERLSMTPGPSGRTKQLARRKGWPPPLAWDDIDDLTERPKHRVGGNVVHRDEMDDSLVERILAGDGSLAHRATVPEKLEVVRRWRGSLNELERLTGWQAQRYTEAVAS